MEQKVRERTLFLLLTEKIDLDEVSINWLEKLPVIGKAFAKERGNDESNLSERSLQPLGSGRFGFQVLDQKRWRD